MEKPLSTLMLGYASFLPPTRDRRIAWISLVTIGILYCIGSIWALLIARDVYPDLQYGNGDWRGDNLTIFLLTIFHTMSLQLVLCMISSASYLICGLVVRAGSRRAAAISQTIAVANAAMLPVLLFLAIVALMQTSPSALYVMLIGLIYPVFIAANVFVATRLARVIQTAVS